MGRLHVAALLEWVQRVVGGRPVWLWCARLMHACVRQGAVVALQDNDSSRRDDDDDVDKSRRTDARPERLKEIEADEKDRMLELEEEARTREAKAAATAARQVGGEAAAGAVSGGDGGTDGAASAAAPGSRGITDLNDNIMKAMLQQVSTPDTGGSSATVGAKRERPADEVVENGDTGGGWSSMPSAGGGLGGSAGLPARRAAPAVDPGRAAATKKAFFSDSREENKPRPGEWLVRERKGEMAAAAAAAAAAAGAGGGAAPGAAAGAPPAADRTAAFENERLEVRRRWFWSMQRVVGLRVAVHSHS